MVEFQVRRYAFAQNFVTISPQIKILWTEEPGGPCGRKELDVTDQLSSPQTITEKQF